jgi:hypothetical protein
MKKYSIDYICCDADYDIWINTNYIIKAEDEIAAMEVASKMEDTINKYIKPFYDREKKDIIVEVIENSYFNKAFITNYTFYDRTKDTFAKNPTKEQIDSLYVQHTKEEFINILEKEYDRYFSKGHNKLTFESISYGVKAFNE